MDTYSKTKNKSIMKKLTINSVDGELTWNISPHHMRILLLALNPRKMSIVSTVSFKTMHVSLQYSYYPWGPVTSKLFCLVPGIIH